MIKPLTIFSLALIHFFREKKSLFSQKQKMSSLSEDIKEDCKEECKVTSLDESEDEMIILISEDLQNFSISKKAVMISEFIKTTIDGDPCAKEVNVPGVTADILAKIVEYMKFHFNNPAKPIEKPLKSKEMKDIACEWDANFVDMDQEVLFPVILATNKMDISPLLELTCAKVATMLKDKTPEEIRKKFNITNDFTPEEERLVHSENKWTEEM